MVAQHSECTKCHWIVHFKLTLCYAHFTTIFKNKQKRCTDKHRNPGNVWNEVQRLWAKLTWDLCRSSLVTQKVKNLSAKQETWTWFLGWEDPLEKGMVTHSRIPAWRIPWTEEPGGLQSMGLQRVGHNWVTITFPFFSPNNVLHWTCFTKQYYMHYPPYSTTQISSNMKINSSFIRLMNGRMGNKMLFA